MDTQVITGIIGDKFYFIEAKKISYKEEGKKTDKKDGIKVTIAYRRKSNRIYQSQRNGTLNDVSSSCQIIWFNWFWKFNW